MSSLEEIKKLADRYPFSEDELEILLRCQCSLSDESNTDSFLMKLAMCSPYSYFFLPGEELRRRVTMVEDYVLPQGFPNELRSAIAADAFVNYAHSSANLSLERFLEGIANTGRRGPKEALRVIYGTVDQPTAQELIDMCFRMSISCDAIVATTVDKRVILGQVGKVEEAINPLVKSLEEACQGKLLTKKIFMEWAEENVPMLSSTLSTFVHNLLFHGHPMPMSRSPYARPILDGPSNIFLSSHSPLLFSLSCASTQFGGKMHRLYSSEADGRSFNRLEWSVLGYLGPTLVILRTEQNAVLGGFASTPWQDSKDFFGDSDCFLFELEPTFHAFRSLGKDNHFMYCHSTARDGSAIDVRPKGLGFGGTDTKPRLFVPETLEECSADFFDSTFESGHLLPIEAMEKFRIKFVEVWGVGGDEAITQALRHRAVYREATDTSINRARMVVDKTQLAQDMHSGLIPNKLYAHDAHVRGRQEFVVDDEHPGSYKIERE